MEHQETPNTNTAMNDKQVKATTNDLEQRLKIELAIWEREVDAKEFERDQLAAYSRRAEYVDEVLNAVRGIKSLDQDIEFARHVRDQVVGRLEACRRGGGE